MRAYLPPVDIAGLPSGYSAGETSLTLSGKPGFAVAFRLVAPGSDAASSKSFECKGGSNKRAVLTHFSGRVLP